MPRVKIIIIISALVLAVILGWVLWPASLYEKYGFSTQMPVSGPGVDPTTTTPKAAELYNKGDLKEARKLLQKEYMWYPQNPLLGYYFAITLIDAGKISEARTILADLHKRQSAFEYDAAFYTALSYIKEGNKAEAAVWLHKIPD